MRKMMFALLLLTLLVIHAGASEDLFDGKQVQQALPSEARALMGERDVADSSGFGDSLRGILFGSIQQSESTLKQGAALCCQILGIVLLCSVLRSAGGGLSGQAMLLAGVLAIGAVSLNHISGFYTLAARTVDSMTAFSGFLFTSLASATAATGAVGSAASIYGTTVMLCGVMTRAAETLILPAISCYMALMVADSALGDGGLGMAGNCVKQLVSNGLKLAVLLMTAYLSVTGVVSGTADAAAVKAAKLTISTAVPVVGSIIADASETLLVSAGVLRSGLGIFGLLGVLAVSVTPFLQTGIHYLILKGTAAAAAIVGEKELSGLISAMAGAMGMLAGLTGACAVMLMVACVCFMRACP